MSRVGVLALQGAFEAHAKVLRKLGHQTVEVRQPADLRGLEGLVLPGGESSAQLRLLEGAQLEQPLDDFVRNSGAPVLATCAGLILAAAKVTGPEQRSFGWLDVAVVRNGWGRQVESFECELTFDFGSGPHAMNAVFIRAPRIIEVGPETRVIGRHNGEPVAVRQGNLIGVTFHPELTSDVSFHRYVFGV